MSGKVADAGEVGVPSPQPSPRTGEGEEGSFDRLRMSGEGEDWEGGFETRPYG